MDEQELKGLVETTKPSSQNFKIWKIARLLCSLYVMPGLVIGLTLSYSGILSSNSESVHLTKQFNFDATRNMKDITEAQVPQVQRPNLFYLQASEQDTPYFVCHTPKTGCTGWKNFYWYLNHKIIQYDGSESSVMNVHHKNAVIQSDNQQSFDDNYNVYRSLFNSKQRIVFARNPYIRFLSSYKDYLQRSKHSEEELPFAKFLDAFETNKFLVATASEMCGEGNECLLNHIESVSKYCSVDLVGGYTVLRIEQQYAWFDAYLDHFGIKPIMEEYIEKGGPKLFEPGSPEYLVTKDGILVNPEGNKKFEAPHNHNAADLVFDYYTSKEMVDRVTKLFMDDFINFGYPLWDGRPETFREA